jgi:hypothetical protein
MNLMGSRQMHEPDVVERRWSTLAGALGFGQLVGGAQVNQQARGRDHPPSLPHPQIGGYVRHDTPVNGWGTRPEPKTSDTVELREIRRRSHERNSDYPRTNQG